MKKNRLIAQMLLLGLSSMAALGQRLDITLTDNSVVSYDVSTIQYMEVLPQGEPGQIDGYWYLGYRVMSGSTVHYDGSEKLTFSGTVLKWQKSTGEEIYDLTYSEDKKSFAAVARATGAKTTFTIVANESDLLVLRVGAIWRYFYKSATAAREASEVESFPNRVELATAELCISKYKTGSSNSSITPMGKHFEKFPAATDEDKEWLENAANQPTFTVGNYTKWTTKTVKLYPYVTPTPADVNQHAIGNCCMCAVLTSFAYIYPGFIQDIITQQGNTFSVKMYDPQGNPITVVVDNKFLCDSKGNLAQCTGKNNAVTWATVLEKALMKWEARFGCNGIEGIGTEHAAPPFTGCGDSFAFTPGTLYPSEMQKVVDWAMQNGMVSVGGFNQGGLVCGTLESVTGHAFTIMYTSTPDTYLWTMRNPWGNGTVDGKLEIPNRRAIQKTIDFRLVYPGAAEPFKKEDLGGYTVPKWTPRKTDLGVDKRLLRQCGIEFYAPIDEVDDAALDEAESAQLGE